MERRRRTLLTWLSTMTLVACLGADKDPRLLLHGPEVVRVDRLGPVVGPEVHLDDGSKPHGIIWSVSSDQVAQIDGSIVVAIGPGEARVVGEWEDQRIEWQLVVELATRLTFVDAPARLAVHEEVALQVEARHGDEAIDVGSVQWATSDPHILQVQAGRALAMAPGMVFVTAQARGAQAVVEIEVR